MVVIDNSQLAVYNSPLEPVFTDEGVTIYAVSEPLPTCVNLGDKVEFLGSVVSQGADGQPQIELYLRCICQMEDDYTLWFHADGGDKPTCSITRSQLLSGGLAKSSRIRSS